MKQARRLKGRYIATPKDCESLIYAGMNGLLFCYPKAIMVHDGEFCYFYKYDGKKFKKSGECNPEFAWDNLNLTRIKK